MVPNGFNPHTKQLTPNFGRSYVDRLVKKQKVALRIDVALFVAVCESIGISMCRAWMWARKLPKLLLPPLSEQKQLSGTGELLALSFVD